MTLFLHLADEFLGMVTTAAASVALIRSSAGAS